MFKNTYTLKVKDKRGLIWYLMTTDNSIKEGDIINIKTPLRVLGDTLILSIKKNPDYIDVSM